MAGRVHWLCWLDENLMSLRVRQCVECPKCRTCYLIAFSPFENGSYLVRTSTASQEEYALYCFCEGARVRSRWCEAKPCEVSRAAYIRGYGTLDEIWPIRRQPHSGIWFDATRYSNLRQG